MVISKRKVVTRTGAALTAAALLVPLMSAIAAGPASATRAPSITSFPRNETLYTSGTAYSPPSNWNPLDSGSRYTGTMGLLYETLFLYDPIHNKYLPWLATSGSWTGPSTYTMQVRNNVKWSNGSSLTGADVAFSINLAKTNPAVPYSNLGQYLSGPGAVASGNTVTVHFTSPAPYAAWQNYLWNQPVLPQSAWSKLSGTDQVTGANTSPVSSGPMTLVPGGYNQTEACYQDNPNWWGKTQLGLSFHFKYLCDVVNGSNNVELSALLSSNIDWSNNFLPGINTLMTIGGNNFIQTYYPSAPYMLSANTAWLELNTSKAPMNNVNFRRAVADAINPQNIVSGVYTGIVEGANPVGLLPNLDSFLNQSAVHKYGFSYNVGKAKAFLKASGYHGQKLTLEVPDGWTDWMAAIQIISQQLNRVGIKVSPIYPSANARTSDQAKGTFDMEINNDVGASSDPWSYFDHVYQLPIGGASNEEAAGLNIERFSDPSAWKLVEQASTTPSSDTATLHGIYGTLEKDFLQELPEIPLWYNGAWFQGNDTYWKDFPSSTTSADQNVPVMWGGYLGAMTTVYALAALRPAKLAG